MSTGSTGSNKSQDPNPKAQAELAHSTVALLDVLSGMLLVELALKEWRKVPFTCDRVPDTESLRSRWLVQIVPLLLFAFANAWIQTVALRSSMATLWYVGVVAAAVVVLRIRRRLTVRHLDVQFDASLGDAMTTLSLSEALS